MGSGDPFLATGGSSGVGQWTHDCISCCGYGTNQPKLAAPRNHSCFIFLVPGSGSTWALVHDFSSGSPLKLPIRWGLCLGHPGRVSTPTFSFEPARTADCRACMWLSLTPWLSPSVVARFQDQLIPRERTGWRLYCLQ